MELDVCKVWDNETLEGVAADIYFLLSQFIIKIAPNEEKALTGIQFRTNDTYPGLTSPKVDVWTDTMWEDTEKGYSGFFSTFFNKKISRHLLVIVFNYGTEKFERELLFLVTRHFGGRMINDIYIIVPLRVRLRFNPQSQLLISVDLLVINESEYSPGGRKWEQTKASTQVGNH